MISLFEQIIMNRLGPLQEKINEKWKKCTYENDRFNDVNHPGFTENTR